ncbi:hypothetical protein ACFVYF_12050, partial [Streptomyces sp. NPDC058274]|uniref:hypothetical protein n=1 Tax=Streptomyces sp. NPDC058274 TaxID=3346416 RepID=UPI0036EE67B4
TGRRPTPYGAPSSRGMAWGDGPRGRQGAGPVAVRPPRTAGVRAAAALLGLVLARTGLGFRIHRARLPHRGTGGTAAEAGSASAAVARRGPPWPAQG